MERRKNEIPYYDPNEPRPDIFLSYDSGCSYSVNLEKRFAIHFPHLTDIVSKIRHCIPAMHIQNHQERCMYLYSTAYIENAGHFHGETAEHQHPELNKLGGQVKQMNPGHRHDTLNMFHGIWNFIRIAMMCEFESLVHYTDTYVRQLPSSDLILERELRYALSQYREKRDHLIGLSALHRDKVPVWRKMDRTPKLVGKGKDNQTIESVYCHSAQKKCTSIDVFKATVLNVVDSTITPSCVQ